MSWDSFQSAIPWYRLEKCKLLKKRNTASKKFLLVSNCPIHLYLIFEKSSWKNQVRQTGFLVYRTRAIITAVCIIFTPFFFFTEVYITDHLCTKTKILHFLSLKSAVYIQERFLIKSGL